MSGPSSPQVGGISSLHLDVSVGDVEAVQVVGGCADVPHDLRSLWEGMEQNDVSNRQHSQKTEGA